MTKLEAKKLVKDAMKLWSKVAKENGWSMEGRGCTIWVDGEDNFLDSVYNSPDDIRKGESYIVRVTEFDYEGFYENEHLIKTIKL